MTALHLRPRGFSELIDATFHIIRARFKPLATVGALMMIPGFALSLALVASRSELVTPPADGSPPEFSVGTWGLVFGLALLTIPLFVIGVGAIMEIASGAYLGRDVEVGDAFAKAKRRFWPMVGAFLLKYLLLVGPMIVLAIVIPMTAAAGAGEGGAVATGLVGGLGMLAYVIAAPILLLRWAVSSPVALFEPVGAGGALSRSGKLTSGSKARLFALYLVFFVIMMVVMMVLMTLGVLLGGGAAAGVAQVLGNLASLVMYPVLAVLQTVIYYDLRIRTEAYDLELMAQGLGAQAAMPPARGAAGQLA